MSVWPAWRVWDGNGATMWFGVRLEFGDGARVDAIAVVSEGCVSIEDVRAEPALSLDDLAALADWIEDPLSEACGIGAVPDGGEPDTAQADTVGPGGADAAPSGAGAAWPGGVEGQWLVAQKYRAAQEQGVDPVLAVMSATGHGRRKSLRLIGQARDAGFLTRRRARR
ncbi:hypothetical protein IM697_17875 [Streptomyces ferrugineus]|uniref:Uncharacterized protein n=1 Tax=Streptomyces ferrugineus TaxID=1413221 RepID=A0A7M2SX68_9ACTN|nr:DUF6214 family protein [Streptomyces ferrugineus]QOV40098.1 hypothetical protein IM697_17875 [Streptomyces ferrugineus]